MNAKLLWFFRPIQRVYRLISAKHHEGLPFRGTKAEPQVLRQYKFAPEPCRSLLDPPTNQPGGSQSIGQFSVKSSGRPETHLSGNQQQGQQNSLATDSNICPVR